jgi:hypothetical protein
MQNVNNLPQDLKMDCISPATSGNNASQHLNTNNNIDESASPSKKTKGPSAFRQF